MPHPLAFPHLNAAGVPYNAAADTAMRGLEINLLGAAQTDVDHTGTTIGQPSRYRCGDQGTVDSHVASDNDFGRTEELRKCPTDAISNVFIQLIRHPAADVISLKTLEHECSFLVD